MIALIVALSLIFGLLIFMWVSIAREPGPGPADVALAFEKAWDELDFNLCYDLSGEELHDGMRRERFVNAKRRAYEKAGTRARMGVDVQVETSIIGNEAALIVTNVAAPGGERVRNNVMLERRSNGWVVVAYSLRTDAEADSSSP